jgi:hypothetical protein
MKESYREDLASHSGLEPYAGDGNVAGVASARGKRRPAIELRNHHFRVPILFREGEGNNGRAANGEALSDTAESKTLCMRGHSKRENREVPVGFPSAEWHVTAEGNGQKTSQTVQLT